jgi:GT2 family glycosyltransferase
MSVFTDLKEIRQLGAPIVGLFRTALARDPDPLEMARLAPLIRARTSLATIACEIVAASEFVRRYAGITSAVRIETFLRNAFGAAQIGLDAIFRAAEWLGSDAEIIALITDAALTRKAIPLLPGLVPGAPPDDDVAYRLWVSEYDGPTASPACEPTRHLVSLLMKAGDTEAEAAERSVESLIAQTHRKWELCLASHAISPWSQQTIEALARDEPRIRLVPEYSLDAAFAAATGPLVGIMAPGDTLIADALARITAAFEPSIGLVFTDEDVEDASGRHSPRFKPGFSPDLPHIIGGLAITRREALDTAVTETALIAHAASHLAAPQIRHLPIVALHRAAAPKPLADDIFAGAPFAVPQPPPPVTVIVLTKDHPELLAACTSGILDRTDYPALDLIVVDNGTTDGEALVLLAELEARDHVRVLRRPGPFNFAALNNDAARTVQGGVLLLLNNDVEILGPDWLSEMVAQLARPGVGIVGARLLYPDHTLQHAGILLGPAGAATHVGRGAAETAAGYLGQLTGVRDFSAVTGACLAIEVDTWNRVGGMDERFAVTWNDVDLCLRVRRAGLRVVWTPRATAIHRESTTRGLEAEDAAKLARFREEQALMLAEWGDAFEHDPFLNPNLVALDNGQLVLTRPRQLASRA